MEVFKYHTSLPGHEDCGTILIVYNIQHGIQVRASPPLPAHCALRTHTQNGGQDGPTWRSAGVLGPSLSERRPSPGGCLGRRTWRALCWAPECAGGRLKSSLAKRPGTELHVRIPLEGFMEKGRRSRNVHPCPWQSSQRP